MGACLLGDNNICFNNKQSVEIIDEKYQEKDDSKCKHKKVKLIIRCTSRQTPNFITQRETSVNLVDTNVSNNSMSIESFVKRNLSHHKTTILSKSRQNNYLCNLTNIESKYE